MFSIQTTNLDREKNIVLYTRETRMVERRAELAAQGVAVDQLGDAIEGGAELSLRIEWETKPAASLGFALEACQITVSTEEQEAPLLTERIPTSEIFLLETQQLIDALAVSHNIYRAGERASSVLYCAATEPPDPLDFQYTAPAYDPTVTAEDATMTSRAAEVIGSMVAETKDGEQRGFAIGILGPRGVPVVTDVIVPPNQEPGRQTTVDFSPEDWFLAQEAVREMGSPFRILGPMHTHPPGSLKPSPDDWDVFLWGGDASSLFILAAAVGRQPVAAGYRWVRGTLERVGLTVEAADEAERVVEQEVI